MPAESNRKGLRVLGIAVGIGVLVCGFCCCSYYLMQVLFTNVNEVYLDDECWTHTDHDLTYCQAWAKTITTQHRSEFMDCMNNTAPTYTYDCLVEKGLGP